MRAKAHNILSNSRAFTLVEVLLAIAIFAIIISTLYSSYTGVFRMVDDNESQADVYHKARIALERMVLDLESLHKDSASTIPLFYGQNREISGQSADTVSFVSRSHLDFGNQAARAEKAIITYDVIEGEEGKGLVLLRHDTPIIGQDPEEEESGLVLCDFLKAVEITYVDASGQAYDDWDASGVEQIGTVPAVVSVALEFMDRNNPHKTFKFMTAAALPKTYSRDQLPTTHSSD